MKARRDISVLSRADSKLKDIVAEPTKQMDSFSLEEYGQGKKTNNACINELISIDI